MKILFVDDDPSVLNGLRRLAFHFPDDWDCQFAVGGAAALELLRHSRCDVVVSDLMMPGTTGAQLFEKLQTESPDTVRIILSGSVDESHSVQVAHLAHQYVAKPCQPASLEALIRRTAELRAALSDPGLQALVGPIKSLPGSPKVYLELARLVDDPSATAEQVAASIGKDLGLSAHLLRLVNSSFFCRGSAIGDLRSAVVRLGLRLVRTLTLSAEVFSASPTKPVPGFSLSNLQDESLKRYMLVERLAQDSKMRGQASAAALLADVGQLVLAKSAPDRLAEAIALATAEKIPLDQAERKLLGTTHAVVGSYLLGIWGFPHDVVDAVAWHHGSPTPRKPGELDATVAVALATAAMDTSRKPDEEWLAREGLAAQFEQARAISQTLGRSAP